MSEGPKVRRGYEALLSPLGTAKALRFVSKAAAVLMYAVPFLSFSANLAVYLQFSSLASMSTPQKAQVPVVVLDALSRAAWKCVYFGFVWFFAGYFAKVAERVAGTRAASPMQGREEAAQAPPAP